jgi:glycosyltransferase involved in cell wall biosynthesis
VTDSVMTSPASPEIAQSEIVEVLFIIDQLCEMGGAERVLLRMIERLPRERYSPRVVTFKIDENCGFREMITCPLEVYPLQLTYDWMALQVARRIAGIVRSHRVRITHTFHETSDLWAGMVAKLSGCPVLISSRRDMGIQRGPGHKIAYRWLNGYFNEVQTVSEQVRQFFIEQDGIDPDRAVTVYNGVDLPLPAGADRRSLRARFGLNPDVPLIVTVGNIRKVKGFDVFLRAAAKVRTVMPEVVFAVAGHNHDPEHFRELESLRHELGMERNFLFLGPMDDVTPLLYASDVFCLLSRSEGLSNALLEAMACELPCVATRVGGNPELVADGQTGFLVGNEDAESAAAKILQLLRRPAAARGMGAAGRRVVEDNFTTEKMMRSLVNSYERLLTSTRSNRR